MKKTFSSIYPYTQEVFAEYELMDDDTIEAYLSKAEKSFSALEAHIIC
jgi:acyl-CoA reductase-like NAD-dependent aldehyde dehydrogenase